MGESAKPPALILGSGSPRRSELLAQLDVPFAIQVIEIDESQLALASTSASAAVQVIARAKFAAFDTAGTDAAVPPTQTILTADTLVACNGRVLGKPESDRDVAEMLSFVSGHLVTVSTAVCIGTRATSPRCEVVTTAVNLRAITDLEIREYVASGVGLDKAGALALQAEASPFIDSVDGCWSNVLGLPLCCVARLLKGTSVRSASRDQCVASRCGVPPTASTC